VAAAVATWRVGLEIRAPDYELYNDVQLGARLALAAAIALAVAALLAAAQSLIGLRNREAHVYAPWRSIWPAVVGGFALYVLANMVNATDFYRPQALALCCAAAPLGFALPRWWLALLPIPVVMVVFQLWPHYECNPEVADCSEGSLTGFGYGLVAVSMGAAIAIGVATRVLQRRGADQQQV
jgi:ABC-type transport system involved in cytochrome c biogenesis permease subunit